MAVQVTPYAPPLAAAGLAFAGAAVWLARRTDLARATTAAAVPLFAATAVWTLGYAAELTVTDYGLQLAFAKLQYVGNATAPVLWFAYVAAYTGYADDVPRWAWGVLALPSAVVLALVAAYPASTLVWVDVTQVRTGGDLLLDGRQGPAFYAFMAYVYALVLATTGMLGERVRSTRGAYRRQAAALLAGALVPALAGLVYIADPAGLPPVNLATLGFVATGGVVGYSVRHSDLFTLEPVAWAAAIAELDDPVFVVDGRERVAAVNPAGEAFADASVGAPASDALGHAFDEPYWRRPGDHDCEYGDGGGGGDDPRALSVSVTALDRDGATAGHVLVVRDVTERKRREDRLAEFASVVSHDLRNPLNVAAGHLELGRETGDDEHFREVDEALDRMERIIDDILALARQEDGDATLDAEPVSLASAARTAWASVETTDADAALDVRGDTTLLADETALVRLLENLFRNAVEHGSTDSRTAGPSDDAAAEHAGPGVAVTVGTTEDGGFYVEDDGPGIPESDREAVFESGFTTSGDGTGFGLSIVAEVADSHGWTVDLADGETAGSSGGGGGGGARFEFDT
jgi:signal transduction histidine kinase